MQELEVIGCVASPEDLNSQQARGRHLREQASRARRGEDRVEVWFTAGLDESVLREFVAAESGCCSFFGFDWHEAERRLAISAPADRRPALDAIAGLLGA